MYIYIYPRIIKIGTVLKIICGIWYLIFCTSFTELSTYIKHNHPIYIYNNQLYIYGNVSMSDVSHFNPREYILRGHF